MEVGDIVICTGYDNLYISTEYGNKNVLEYNGYDRNHHFVVKYVYINYHGMSDDLIDIGSDDGTVLIRLEVEFFTPLSEIREEVINKLI